MAIRLLFTGDPFDPDAAYHPADATPGASALPVRDKACPMKDADLVALDGGEIVLVGAGCQHLLMETWIPAQKRWSPTSLERLVFHDETSMSVLGPTELLVDTIGTSGDGEPFEAQSLLRLQSGTWKSATSRHRSEATLLPPALRALAKQEGATRFVWDAEPVQTGGRTYLGGAIYRGEDAQGTVLLCDQAVKARGALNQRARFSSNKPHRLRGRRRLRSRHISDGR